MGMQVHELHPALVHGPLTLLPAASVIDLLAAMGGKRNRPMDRFGRGMWIAGVGSTALAGLAGLAASQQVRPSPRAERMMYVHGVGNVGILVAATGMAIYRARHSASIGTGLIGLAACSAAIYTAYLGGKMVYAHGVGVKDEGVKSSPELFSRSAAPVLIRDTIHGLGWVFRKTITLLKQPAERTATREALPPLVSPEPIAPRIEAY